MQPLDQPQSSQDRIVLTSGEAIDADTHTHTSNDTADTNNIKVDNNQHDKVEDWPNLSVVDMSEDSDSLVSPDKSQQFY